MKGYVPVGGPLRDSDGSPFTIATRRDALMAWGYRTSAAVGEGAAVCLMCGQIGLHVHAKMTGSDMVEEAQP